MSGEGARTRPGAVVPLLALLPVLAYGGAYAWARATHRLVRYTTGSIARPQVWSGKGVDWWEVVFSPATAAERRLRRAAGSVP